MPGMLNGTRGARSRGGSGTRRRPSSPCPGTARPKNVILHVNSGGNAYAAASELRNRGYRVEPTDYDPFGPGNYGVQLRVGLKENCRRGYRV